MLKHMYVLVRREDNILRVVGTRRELGKEIFMFPPELRDLSSHPEVEAECKKHTICSFKNVKLTGPVVAKYYDSETEAFRFKEDFLVEDVDNSMNLTSEGDYYF
jgi:hypothetical protein